MAMVACRKELSPWSCRVCIYVCGGGQKSASKLTNVATGASARQEVSKWEERGRGQNEEVVMGTENMQKNVKQEVAMLGGGVP